MENEDLLARVESLEANRVASLIVMTALIQSTPDQTGLHLRMTSLLEQQLGANGRLGALLSEQQKEYVREFVEQLGAVHRGATGSRPPPSPKAR